jgi:hypothetical protein
MDVKQNDVMSRIGLRGRTGEEVTGQQRKLYNKKHSFFYS